MTYSFMLDTNIISDCLRNPNGTLASKINRHSSGTLCTSIIVAAELRFGVDKKSSQRLRERIEEFLAVVIAVLPFGNPADLHYARIRTELEASGKTIGPNDLLIAAHACATGTILVTNNIREFSRARGLRTENWL